VVRLEADDDTRALWVSTFTVSLTVSLGGTLAMTAEVENVGHEALAYELALHTYLAVVDVEAVSIRGLEGAGIPGATARAPCGISARTAGAALSA